MKLLLVLLALLLAPPVEEENFPYRYREGCVEVWSRVKLEGAARERAVALGQQKNCATVHVLGRGVSVWYNPRWKVVVMR